MKLKKIGHDDFTLFSLAIFTMAIIGHLLNEGRRELEEFDSSTHPHPEIRLDHFTGGLAVTLNHLEPRNFSVLDRAQMIAVDGVLIAFRSVSKLEEAFPAIRKSRDAFLDRLAMTGALRHVVQEWEQFSMFALPWPDEKTIKSGPHGE